MESIILAYLRPELSVLIPVLYFIGMALKQSKLNDKYIPLALGASGILLAVIYCSMVGGFGLSAIFTGACQGVLCAAGSVYCNQIIKQLRDHDGNS